MIGLLMLAIGAPLIVNSYTTGNQLYEFCQHDKASICAGYVAGVADSSAALSRWGAQPMFCKPPEVTLGQAIDVVVKSLEDHPETRHLAAAGLVIAAFHDAFPCR